MNVLLQNLDGNCGEGWKVIVREGKTGLPRPVCQSALRQQQLLAGGESSNLWKKILLPVG